MSYNIKVNCIKHDAKYIANKSDINQKEDYSYILYWKENIINKKTNMNRF